MKAGVWSVWAAVAWLGLGVGSAHAVLTITPDGAALGLSLRTFATGFPTVAFSPTNVVGPTGITFAPDGGVLVADATGKVRKFATDTNNQNAASASPITQYQQSLWGMTRAGDDLYLAGANTLVKVNANGTFQDVIRDGFVNARGLVTDPRNGKLFLMEAGSGLNASKVWSVDPIAKTRTVFKSGLNNADGITISPNGATVYGVNFTPASGTTGSFCEVIGWNSDTQVEVFRSGTIIANGTTPYVDGIAVGTGSFANKLFANTGNGNVVQVDLGTKVQTLIATGGSRGDFVTVDPFNDTLLITQQTSVMRLVGSSFSDPPLTRGDANRDRAVDFDDLLILAQNYGVTIGGYWDIGDFNIDDAVNFDDLLALAQNYGFGTTSLTASGVSEGSFATDWALAQSLVPEPALLTLAPAITAMTRRRRFR